MDENQPIILDWLFDERSNILFKLPNRPKNKYEVKRFIERI